MKSHIQSISMGTTMLARLSHGADNGQEPVISAEFAGPVDEQTIELEITAQDLIGLWSASTAESPAPASITPIAQTPAIYARLKYEAHAAIVKLTRPEPITRIAASVILTSALVLLGTAAYRASKPITPPPHHTANSLAQAAPPAPTVVHEQRPPVRIRNPFDRSEIFEFPPGTPKRKARQAVAALLLERARDRQTRRGGKPPSAA